MRKLISILLLCASVACGQWTADGLDPVFAAAQRPAGGAVSYSFWISSVMTDSNAPSPATVMPSFEYPGQNAWHMFGSDPSLFWNPYTNYVPNWVTYTLGSTNSARVVSMMYKPFNYQYGMSTFKLQGSNSVSVDLISATASNLNPASWQIFTVQTPAFYAAYTLSASGAYVGPNPAKFWLLTSGTPFPIMNSTNTVNGYCVTASSTADTTTRPIWKAEAGIFVDIYGSWNSTGSSGEWVEFDYPAPVTVAAYWMAAGFASRGVNAFSLQHYNGASWVSDQTSNCVDNQLRQRFISGATATSTRWRIYMTSGFGSDIRLNEIMVITQP